MRIVLTVGLPASGKSTFAKELVGHRGYKRLNRDELRSMIDAGMWSDQNELYVRHAEVALADIFLAAGYSVVVDDCNLSKTTLMMWTNLALEWKVPLVIKDFTDVPLEECIRRDALRPHPVGEKAIRKMHQQFLAQETSNEKI